MLTNTLLTEDEIYEVLDDAMDEVPEDQFARIQNVIFNVVDEPTTQHRRNVNCDSPFFELLGLYQGVPLERKGAGYGLIEIPDRIWIFTKPIERHSRGDVALFKDNLARTLHHEIGHYFGMSDARLAEFGY